jgi:predicted MFS family arabinose efflux permease
MLPVSENTLPMANRFTVYQTLVVGLLALMQFSVVAGHWLFASVGLIIMPALAISPAEFGMVVAAYGISAGLAGLLTLGFLDRFDRKTLLLVLFSGHVAATLWCGLAGTFATLLAGRVTAGVFGGVLSSSIIAIAADYFRRGLHSRVMAVILAASAGSQALGLPAGLYLSSRLSWHAPFFVLAAIGAVGVLVLSLWLQPLAGRSLGWTASPLPDLRLVIREPQNAWAIMVTALLTLFEFLLIPLGTFFAVNNFGVPEGAQAAIYLVVGFASLLSGGVAWHATRSAGIWPVFLTGHALTSAAMLIYTSLDDASLATVLLLNILIFAGISARSVSLQAIMAFLPEGSSRRATFNAVIGAVQHLAAGVAGLVVGGLVASGTHGEVLRFDLLGHALAAVALLVTGLVWKMHAAMARRADGAGSNCDTRKETTH